MLDSGLDQGRRQIAIDAALAQLHAAGDGADTIRLFRLTPTVLVGRFQTLRREVHVERCQSEGVALARRLTGGGAVYIDEGQICWGLVCHRRSLGVASLAECAERVCQAVATGLHKRFGVDARFRPPGDIEVGGRKVGGTAGSFSGDTVLYQGTVLAELDPKRIMRLLNIPASPVLERAWRAVALHELLGRAPALDEVQTAIVEGLCDGLGIVAESAPLKPQEEALAARILRDEVGSDVFVLGPPDHGDEHVLVGAAKGDCGEAQARVRLEASGPLRRIREIVFAGTFQLEPARALYDLEAALRGVRASDALDALERNLAGSDLAGSDLPAILRQALSTALASDARGRLA